MVDFFLGCYQGLAYGDAFGAPFEFRVNARRQVTQELVLPLHTISRFQGVREGVLGQVTDDTEMTLALLTSVADHQTYDQDHVIKSYLLWANQPGAMLGRNTRALMKGITTTRGFWKRHVKRDFSKMESNGCLMRCTGLLPLLFNDNFKYFVHQDVNLTNDNQVCRDCVLVYLEAFRDIWKGSTKDQTYRRLRMMIQSRAVQRVFDQAWDGTPRDVTGPTKGWILHAFHLAFYHFFKETPFTEAIYEITCQRGDTDTNAAIAGALLGAREGREKLAQDSLFERNMTLILDANTNHGDYPRIDKYHPKMFRHLVERVIATIL